VTGEARILLVEDEPNMARTLARNLERAGYRVDHAPHGEAALARLATDEFDVVLTDLKMPVMDGMALLRAMHERHVTAQAVVLTGFGTIETAVEAMKLGAADYLIKDARPQEVLMTLARVLKLASLQRENQRLRRELGRTQVFGDIIGHSQALHEVWRLVDAVAPNKSTVLLTGESGTGKELIARTIHARGPMPDAPFVAINCAGLSETLLDSQLFGHRRGAFTGATSDHDGVFRAATGGTLLLDEVGEIPLSLQAKFLRAIQEREVTPLGSSRPVPVDVRLIAATNRDLADEVRTGRFRQDLYYRLNVVHIELPPLRARREDVPLLVEHFLARYAAQYQVEPKTLAPDAFAALERYPWPGNIRELQNAIERAFALSHSDVIGLDDLPAAVQPTAHGAAPADAGLIPHSAPSLASSAEDDTDAALPTLAEAERRLIGAALARAGGNKNEAARLLGIDRQRLYRKIAKYNL
jgi:two-component system, NtrC family, response regulator AtoC